jgi:hypothetical protein
MSDAVTTPERSQTNAAVQPMQPAQPAALPAPAQAADDFDVTLALMRLLVGAALVGGETLRARLRQWESELPTSAPANEMPPGTVRGLVRHAMLGMLFETEQRVGRGLSTAAYRSGVATRFLLGAMARTLQWEPLDPVRWRVDDLLTQGMETVRRWTAAGELEEEQARWLARKALPGALDEFLDVLTKNPEVRALVEEQSVGLAGAAVNEVRERTVSADVLAERLVHGLLRRPVENGSPPPTPPRRRPVRGQDRTP